MTENQKDLLLFFRNDSPEEYEKAMNAFKNQNEFTDFLKFCKVSECPDFYSYYLVKRLNELKRNHVWEDAKKQFLRKETNAESEVK